MLDVLATYTAEQLVVLDESSKDGRTLIRRYGRAVTGSRASAMAPLERGTRYSIKFVWGCSWVSSDSS